jgi:hypothetical protein
MTEGLPSSNQKIRHVVLSGGISAQDHKDGWRSREWLNGSGCGRHLGKCASSCGMRHSMVGTTLGCPHDSNPLREPGVKSTRSITAKVAKTTKTVTSARLQAMRRLISQWNSRRVWHSLQTTFSVFVEFSVDSSICTFQVEWPLRIVPRPDSLFRPGSLRGDPLELHGDEAKSRSRCSCRRRTPEGIRRGNRCPKLCRTQQAPVPIKDGSRKVWWPAWWSSHSGLRTSRPASDQQSWR